MKRFASSEFLISILFNGDLWVWLTHKCNTNMHNMLLIYYRQELIMSVNQGGKKKEYLYFVHKYVFTHL